VSIAAPGPEQVSEVLELIKEEKYFTYFFHNLNSPSWLQPLKDAGLFLDPPGPVETDEGLYHIPVWEASKYLIRVANIHPELVLEIALELETENFRVHQDLLQATMNMPPHIAVQMVPAVARWLDSRFESLIPEYAGNLMVYLAEGNQWEAALDLLVLLTEPVIEQRTESEDQTTGIARPSRARPRFERYMFEKLLKERVPRLARHRPFEVLEVLEKQLTKAIEYEERAGLRQRGTDGSIAWRAAIEDHPQNGSIRGFKELLTEAIRDLLEVVATEEQTRSILERYLEHRYSIFRRLAIHIVRLHPEHYQDLPVKLFSDRDNLSDPNIHHEFYLLMESAFRQSTTRCTATASGLDSGRAVSRTVRIQQATLQARSRRCRAAGGFGSAMAATLGAKALVGSPQPRPAT